MPLLRLAPVFKQVRGMRTWMEDIGSVCLEVGKRWYAGAVLGYGRRLGVWMQGCGRRCPGCISPELQPPEGGTEIGISEIEALMEGREPVDGLTVSGGEPFDQPEGLLALVRWFADTYGDDILIYTGYTLEELHGMNSGTVEEILTAVSVLVDGSYVEENNDGIGLRGSSNQRIHVMKNRNRYSDAQNCSRKVQCVFTGKRVWIIGIPPKPER